MKRLKALLNKLSYYLNQSLDVGVYLKSPILSQLNSIIKSYPLSALLPYESYDKESGLYYNQDNRGFMLEATPMTGASEETITLLNGLIADSLPENVTLQVILLASPRIEEGLTSWSNQRLDKTDILKTLSEWRVEYLKQGAFKSLIPHDTYLIRDFRLFICVAASENDGTHAIERLIPLRDEMVSTLKSAGIHSKNVEVESFISLMNELINPNFDLGRSSVSWNPHDSLNLQVTSPETNLLVTKDRLIFNENEWDVRSFHVREYPKNWAQWGMNDLIGDLYRDALRIPCPFLVNFTVYIPPRDKAERQAAIKNIRSDQKVRSPLARFMPVTHKISHDWKYVTHRLEEGDRLVKCFYEIVLYAPYGEGDIAETFLKNLYQAKGWKLSKPRFLQLQSWLSSMPMLMGSGLLEDLKRFGRFKTVLSQNAANLLPLQGEWKGMNMPRLLLTRRRGQLMWWDNFSNEEGNYNVAVVGKSGSGKSVFMQEMMTSLLGSGGRVWVLDVGRSFQRTCELLGGEFMEFTPLSNICINPFTFITDFDEALSLLKPMFSMMAKPTQKTTDHENALLEQALKAAFQHYKNETTVTNISEWLLKHPDKRANDLGTMLFPYSKEGMYGRFFEGRCTLNLQAPLCVLELEELKAKKDLQEVVLLVLMYQVTEAMYRGKRMQPMACIIDEAWDLLRGDQSGEFVETGCRRARKYLGAFITGTQSVNDYYKTPAAKAAFENSDWLCLLSQKPESIDELKASKRLHLDGHKERLLKSVKTIQGFYAEIFIYGPPGYAIGRLMLDPFSRVLYSSKGQDYALVKAYQAEGFTLTQAISKVAQSYQ